MGINEIMQLVSTIGFPIAACVMVWGSSERKDKKLQEVIEASTRATTETAAAVSALTEAVKELRDLIGGGE